MKRRILMVSAMILLFGSQMQMNAQKKDGPDGKRPGMEMKFAKKPGRPMDGKAISQRDVERVKDFYWMKYRVRLSKKEAVKILMEDRKDRGEFAHKPHGPKPGQKPGPMQMKPEPRKPLPPRK